MFVDRRADLADGRTLFAVGDTVLNAYPRGFSVVHGEDAVYFQLPCDHDWRASRGWHHVGMHVETDGNVTVFVDGNPIGTKRIDHISLLHAGMVVSLGAASDKPGVRGWFDEFRLVVDGDPSHLKSPSSIELLCNYARGTMAAFTSGSPLSEHGVLWDEIDARASLRGVTTKQDESLLCVTDYSRDLGVGRGRLPEGARSMRDAILELAEGTPLLQAGVPRPDTRTNSFCRSCHVAASEDPFRPAALLDTALSEGKVPVELDPRSQPMQPFAMPGQPPLVHGNIPEHWIMSKYGTAAPEAHQSLSEDYPVLNWLLAGF